MDTEERRGDVAPHDDVSQLKVFLAPTGTYSRAMVRIARGLETYAPKPHVTIVDDELSADLIVIYAIGKDANDRAREILARGQRYAVVQCCWETCGYLSARHAFDFWHEAELVWSYYDLSQYASTAEADFNFYHAPLALDDCFLPEVVCLEAYRQQRQRQGQRSILATGYVSSPNGGEAILEAWEAARRANLAVVHVGSVHVDGVRADGSPGHVPAALPPHVFAVEGVSNEDLALLYSSVSWVVSLRHVEGFELPAVEGLAFGARPILFDQLCLRHWYGDHAVYVPECHGEELISHLAELFRTPPHRVSGAERDAVLSKFNSRTISEGFWTALQNADAGALP